MDEKTKVAVDDPLLKDLNKLLKRLKTFGEALQETREEATREARAMGKTDEEIARGTLAIPLEAGWKEIIGEIMGAAGDVTRRLDHSGIKLSDVCDCPQCAARREYRAKHGGAEMPDPNVIYAGSA